MLQPWVGVSKISDSPPSLQFSPGWWVAPVAPMQVRAIPTCTAREAGGIGPQAHHSVRRQVVDDQDNTQRGEALGPHAHGNTARHVVDEGKNRKTTPATTSTAPVCQLLGSANAETTPAGTRATAAVSTQRPDAARKGKNG